MGDITFDNFEIKFHEINYNIQKANYIGKILIFSKIKKFLNPFKSN